MFVFFGSGNKFDVIFMFSIFFINLLSTLLNIFNHGDGFFCSYSNFIYHLN